MLKKKFFTVLAVSFFVSSALFLNASMAACPDDVICFGSGGKTGEFYRTANILQKKAEEEMIPVHVISPGGSKFNCDGVKNGDLHFGWAMKKVAEAEGITGMIEAPFSEAMLLIAQKGTIEYLSKESMLRTWDKLLSKQRLKIAVLGGLDSGEAAFAMANGVDKDRIKGYKTEEAFIKALSDSSYVVGFVSRYPNPYSELLQAADKADLEVTGALSRSLIKQGLRANKITIPGFGEVKTVIMPVVAIFNPEAQYSEETTELVNALKDVLQGMTSEEFSPQPTLWQKAWLKLKGWKDIGLVKFEQLKDQI